MPHRLPTYAHRVHRAPTTLVRRRTTTRTPVRSHARGGALPRGTVAARERMAWVRAHKRH